MKILIRGAGFQNKGAEAMLKATVQLLGMRVPGATFYSTVTAQEARYAYISGVSPIFKRPTKYATILSMLPCLLPLYEYMLSRKKPDFARAVKTHKQAAYEIATTGAVDAVVDVSGFLYGDTWGPNWCKYAWPWVEYCAKARKPYVFLSQAWGPFENTEVAYWVAKFCNAAALVTSRDHISSQFLARICDVETCNIQETPDVAFCFQGGNRITAEHTLRGLGLEQDRPLIGLVPNMKVYERTEGIGADNTYISLLTKLANQCIDRFDANILLAPNQINVPGNSAPDDRFLCSMVVNRIQQRARCFVLRDYLSSETIKAVLGQLDLLVSSRFHSLVFALSQGVPVIALGWSHKYQELLREFGLENSVIDHESLNTDKAMTLIQHSIKDRDNIIHDIKKALPSIQDKVNALFDSVANILKKAETTQ